MIPGGKGRAHQSGRFGFLPLMGTAEDEGRTHCFFQQGRGTKSPGRYWRNTQKFLCPPGKMTTGDNEFLQNVNFLRYFRNTYFAQKR